MKKILLWMLVVSMVVVFSMVGSLVGCKPAAEEEAAVVVEEEEEAAVVVEEEEEEAVEESAEEKPTVVWLTPDTSSHPYWWSQKATYESYADELGVEMIIYDSVMKPDTQASQLDTAIGLGVDAILYTDAFGGQGVGNTEKIVEAGIPVVVTCMTWEEAKYDVSVIFSERDLATKAGQYILEFLENKYGEPKGKIYVAQGSLADSGVVVMNEVFGAIMEPYENIEIIIGSTDWDLEKAANVAQDAFVADPDIDAIFLHSDFLIPSIIPLVEDKPKVGEDGHIFVVGRSGDSVALSYIKKGIVDASMNMSTIDLAKVSLDFALKLINGGKILPGDVIAEDKPWGPVVGKAASGGGVDFEILVYRIDASNVDDPSLWGNQFLLEE